MPPKERVTLTLTHARSIDESDQENSNDRCNEKPDGGAQARILQPKTLHIHSKIALVLVLAVLNAATGLVMKSAVQDEVLQFSTTAVTCISEICKFSFCAIMVVRQRIQHLEEEEMHHTKLEITQFQTFRVLFAFFCPSLGYFLMNNLRFYLAQALNPGLLGVVWNLKIVIIAVLYTCPPTRRFLSKKQWCGIMLLVTSTAGAEYSQWNTLDSDGDSNSGGVHGLVLLAIGLLLTSGSSIACEYAYKSTGERSIYAQGSIMYSYGVVFNLLTFLAHGGHGVVKGFPGSLLIGFNGYTWLLIVFQAASGFVAGAVFKHIDAIAQVYADMIAMFLQAFAAWQLFGLRLNTIFCLSLLVSASSLRVYYCDMPEVGWLLQRINIIQSPVGLEQDVAGSDSEQILGLLAEEEAVVENRRGEEEEEEIDHFEMIIRKTLPKASSW